MDEKVKQPSSFQLDQEILDARGINMTVEEVAGLPTGRYSERVRCLQLGPDDLAFLKGLRRRIKNRLSSQNSRRRNMEHLRRLTAEICVVRECKTDVISERNSLLQQRIQMIDKCKLLRDHIVKNLRDKSSIADLPEIDYPIKSRIASQQESQKTTKTKNTEPEPKMETTDNKTIFECRLEKLVQKSVNHIYKEISEKPKKVCAKTIFLSNISHPTADSKTFTMRQSAIDDLSIKQYEEDDLKSYGIKQSNMGSLPMEDESMGVLNLSIKQGGGNGRKSHGRKQSAPRRIVYVYNDSDDYVLDLKVKKEHK